MSDKFYEMWKPVLNSFENVYPELYELMIDWYPIAEMEIAVKLSDGRIISYDMMGDFISNIHNPVESKEQISEMEWRRNFSKRLIAKLNRAGLTQDRLSEMTGISKVSINRYINEKASPNGYTLDRIANVLNCSVNELVGFKRKE